MSGFSRRDFLGRAARAGATVAAAGAAGILLHEEATLGAKKPQRQEGRALDYRAKAAGPKLAIATGPQRAASARAAVEALGGMGRFVAKGERVLVKVNAGFARPAWAGATAHPDVVSEVVKLCLAAGAAEVVVTDNPVNDAASCFDVTGIRAAVESSGGRVAIPKTDDFRDHTVPDGLVLRDWPVLLGPLDGMDRVIGLCPAKDHGLSRATLTVKNWYGLLGGRRNTLHQRIHDTIRDLALLVRPTLVILDGTTPMLRNGPTGGSVSDLGTRDTVVAGTDPVAVDAFGATLLGLTGRDLPGLAPAAAAGAGTLDWESLKPVRVKAGS
ncbi:MAG: DUF362 domain-containing protein [Deltaproteobacteria bacterium]|nr:DUF362 domain-containing protein [Deltaproteobacteria bacterium]